MTTLNKLRDVL